MADSFSSKDPPGDGTPSVLQRVMTGFSRLQQPRPALRRSTSTTPFHSNVSAPAIHVSTASTSSSIGRFLSRPDPPERGSQGEPAISLTSAPHVETRRGGYDDRSFSILPASLPLAQRSLLGSVSPSLQDQVHRMEDGLDAIFHTTSTPPSHILVNSYSDESYYDSAHDAIPDSVDPEVDDDYIRPPSPVLSIISSFGRMFPFAQRADPSPALATSVPIKNGSDAIPAIDQPTTSHDRVVAPPSLGSASPSPFCPTIWYNTDGSWPLSATMLTDVHMDIENTTPRWERDHGPIQSFSINIRSTHQYLQWGLRVGHHYDLRHFTKYDCGNSRQDARLILIGRTAYPNKINRLFGLRINLVTGVREMFPLFIRGITSTPLTVLHPYLHGFHGSTDPSFSGTSGIYSVPTSWGGQQVLTNESFALAWALWADFKFRCKRMPNVQAGCRQNARPSPKRSHRSGLEHNTTCLHGHPPYEAYRPEIPPYILDQFDQLGHGDPHVWTSFHDCPEPSHGERLSGDFIVMTPPETDTPQADTPMDVSVSSSHSSSLLTGSKATIHELGSIRTSTPDVVMLDTNAHFKVRSRTIDFASVTPRYRIPSNPDKFTAWKLLVRSELRGAPWMSANVHILSMPLTTDANRHLSESLSQFLFRCGSESPDQVVRDFFLHGEGNALTLQQKGCEAYRLLDSTFHPTGARWLWTWEEHWTTARHEQGESLTALRGRLQDLADKLGSSGLVISREHQIFKFLVLACTGPYHDVFTSVYNKLVVTNDPDWALDKLTLNDVESRLQGMLVRSHYGTADQSLLRGAYPTHGRGSKSSGTAGGSKQDDQGGKAWIGSKELRMSQALECFTIFTCPICRTSTHSFAKCGVARKAGFRIQPISQTNQAAPTTSSSVDVAKAGPASSLRFGANTKPAAPAGTTPAAPKATPVSIPTSSNVITGRQADAPSIGSESFHDAPDSPGDISSDDDGGPNWNAPNDAAISAIEASRARANLASESYLNAARRFDSRRAGGRGRGHRDPTSQIRGNHVTVSNPIIAALDGPVSEIWTPVELSRSRARKSKHNVTTYVCADSGASRDLFTQRDWFVDYTDIQSRQEYVVVANDTRVPIHGIGTVRFQLNGHEVLLRRVYHVPGLNGSLLSIRTHRRRGPGCTFLADSQGCHLTFPGFVVEIDDSVDVLIACGPSEGGTLSYEQPPPHSTQALHARNKAIKAHASCRRSRIPIDAVHLQRPDPVSAKNDLEELIHAVLPTHYVPESSSTAVLKQSSAELHRLFGCRKLDYSTLPFLGDGLHVTTDREPPMTIGDTVNINRGARGGPVPRPPRARHTIGADIGFGEGSGPGGYKYCLFLVDLATRYTWVYGLSDLSGDSIADALWRFFVDAGGFPTRFRCDFDRRFLQGKVGRLLRSHGVKIGASPPHRQSQNGAVERHWNTAVEMGRAFLAEANLPKRYWFWAVREASIRMNMLPVRSGPASDEEMGFLDHPLEEVEEDHATVQANLATTAPSTRPRPPKKKRTRSKNAEAKARQWSTPLELYYGIKPDYRVLFRFGSIGYFRRTIESSGKAKSKFSSKSHFGIALGRSDYTNGMMFWDPSTSCFSVSADYRLDPDRGLGDPFPGIYYDGGMAPSLISGSSPPKEPFPPGSTVYAIVDDDVYEGVVVSVPTPNCDWYSIRPTGSDDNFKVPPCDLCSPDDPMIPLDRNLSTSSLPTLPTWFQQGSHVTLETDGAFRPGYLGLTGDGSWEFFQRDGTGQVTYRLDLGDLPHTWRSRLLDGTLQLGWNAPPRAYHVHAGGLQQGVPGSFRRSMRKNYVDHGIWIDSYTEEYVSLRDKNTFRTITWDEYERLYSHIKIIPTMNIQTIKTDEVGVPIRAKSRVVALGNHEDTIWEPGDLHAPVIRKESDRLLTTIAVNMGRTQKQGDCKTAFLHPTLPPDEIVIVRPPPGCPFSKPGELWFLNKTLYGLRRSPKHWYDALCGALQEIGMHPLAHDPCVFTGTLIPGGPLLYLGVYVDDFTYFSESDEVERVFEAALSSKLSIDWMGEVGWFLGKAYEWVRTPDNRLQVTITQTAKIEAMLEDLNMSDCNPVKKNLPVRACH